MLFKGDKIMYKNDCFFLYKNKDIPRFCTQSSNFLNFNCKKCDKYMSQETAKHIIDRLAEIGEVGYPMSSKELKQAMIEIGE